MKKAVKISFLLTTVILAIGLLAGCGSKKKNELPEGTVTLTVGIPQNSNVTDYENNEFTKLLESKLDVKIKFVFFPSGVGDYKKQLTLMCGAQEELPDVLLGLDLGHYTMNQYGEDGYFIDLTEYIDDYGENYKKAMDTLDKEVKDYVEERSVNTKDGAIYGMPRVICTASDDLQSPLYINKAWLDKLGLSMPTTVDELRTVLQAFKTKDPNGNGKADEIPMLGSTEVEHYLINAFTYYDSGRFSVDNGQVYDPVTTDEYRQALIFGNQLVKDGLYGSLSFTIKANTEYRSLISPVDEPCKVGIFCGNPGSRTNVDTDVLKDFVALPALADATGKGGYTVVDERKIAWTGFVTKDCEYPAVAMKFLDLFYTDEVITAQRHGKEGVDWESVEGENYFGTKSHVKVINTEAYTKGNSTWCNNVLGITSHYNYLAVLQEGEGRASDLSRLLKESYGVQTQGTLAKERAIYMNYTTEEYEVQEEYVTPVSNFVNEAMTNFFSGQKDPNNDADWNEYLQNLETTGRSKLLKVAQDAYGRK